MTDKPSFEKRDIRFDALISLLGLLLILLSLTVLITHAVHRVLLRTMPHSDAPSPLADLHRLPPEPRLQADPAVDLIRLRDVEDVTLNNYAWIDPAAGKVRIPITRAMAIWVKEQGE